MKRTLFLVLFILIPALRTGAQDWVPLPVKIICTEGYFPLRPILGIYYSPEVEPLSNYLEYELRRMYRFDVVHKIADAKLPSDSGNTIQIYVDHISELPPEGYRLKISEKDILIAGKDYGGIFNGIQTLLQMLPDPNPLYSESKRADLPVPCVDIVDYPRFRYRGMMLDAARTFVPAEEVKRYIDRLSRHKINKFHWHLSDDEGWRIEIKSHPELALQGGYRGGDSPIMPVYGCWNRKYGGFYSQDEIRDIVEYASVRNVEIIPEIDLPGHSRAAARIHPEILCAERHDTSPANGYDVRNVWCASREENFVLLDDILREVAGLFPSSYIHIGGDEVSFKQWMACPGCRALMRREGYTDGTELQSRFMERVCTILGRYGKKAAVWSDSGDGTLPQEVRIYGWQTTDSAGKAALEGYETVIMPSEYFYFDMKYTADEPGLRWAGIISTEKVYSFDTDQEGFTPSIMENVAGIEGALWHELGLANGPEYMYRQSYPRICALAEVAWTPQAARNWDDFCGRMERTHFARLSRMGIRYRRPLQQPKKSEPESYIVPHFTVTSSLPASASHPYSNLTSYNWKSHARTARGSREGDYFIFTFNQPAVCGSIEIVTGYAELPRCLFPTGYAEVLYADTFGYVRCGNFKDNRVKIFPTAPVKAIRIVCTSPAIGEEYVIIQPLKITPLRRQMP